MPQKGQILDFAPYAPLKAAGPPREGGEFIKTASRSGSIAPFRPQPLRVQRVLARLLSEAKDARALRCYGYFIRKAAFKRPAVITVDIALAKGLRFEEDMGRGIPDIEICGSDDIHVACKLLGQCTGKIRLSMNLAVSTAYEIGGVPDPSVPYALLKRVRFNFRPEVGGVVVLTNECFDPCCGNMRV